jgi:plastocyanin
MLRKLAATAFLLTASAALIAPAEAATLQVTIAKMAFSPPEITAQVGDTIEWTNNDFVAHTATARDKSFDIVIPAHGTGSVVIKTVGTVDYFCRFHPMMKGMVAVKGN